MTVEKIKLLRKELPRYPELSGQEVETAGQIKKFIEKYYNAKTIENIRGNGLAVIETFSNSGPAIFIRCQLDALPIEEENNFEHQSPNNDVSHSCGHDDHMAIVAVVFLLLIVIMRF